MLLPDNIQPELSIYYNASIILNELKTNKTIEIFDLYQKVKRTKEMAYRTFVLCLDWLYLIEIATVDDEGWVELCF